MPKNLLDKAAIIRDDEVRQHMAWWKALAWGAHITSLPFNVALLQDYDQLKRRAEAYMAGHLKTTHCKSGSVRTYKKLFGDIGD